MGPGPHPDRGNVTGNLYELVSDVLAPPDNTRNTNVSPSDQVNFVIHTHLHADHVGWNLRYSGGMPAPNFRRARYIISKDDYDYYTEEKMLEQSPHVQRQVIPLRRLRLQQIVEGEHEVSEGVMVVPAPGHTPGHQVVLINSGGRRPWSPATCSTTSPRFRAHLVRRRGLEQGNQRRQPGELLDLAEKEGWVVAAGHFPPGKQIGKVVREGSTRHWEPL